MGSLGEGTEEEKEKEKNEELVGATVGYGVKSKPTVAMMECVQQLSDHPKVHTRSTVHIILSYYFSQVIFNLCAPSLTHVQQLKYCTVQYLQIFPYSYTLVP